MTPSTTATGDATELSRLLASALEQTTESIFVTTAETNPAGPTFVFANSAFTRMTGYTAEDVMGKTPDLLQGPHSDRTVLDRVRKSLARAEPFVGELVVYRKDGSPFVAEWELAPIRNVAGATTHFVTVMRDVTAAKRAEAELLEAKAMAEAADHAKSAFFASMSHELRTPLNAIIGFSELLVEHVGGPLTEKQQKYAESVLGAGRDLLDLIDQVLDLTRVDVDLLEVDPTPIRITEVFESLDPLLAPLKRRRQLSYRLELSEGLPPVFADARKIKQIVYSLLSSAIRTAPPGGELVVRGQIFVDAGADMLELIITGSGRPGGAPASATDVAGTPAFGLDHPHSGLGLDLTRKLVDLHDGTLAASTESLGGISYCLRVPVRRAREGPRETRPSPRSGEGALVLVVEDNSDASDLLTHYLVEAGYSVARAYTGEEGIRRARELRPVLITMDSELPDRNGLEVVSALAEHPGTAGCRVIVVSVVDRPITPGIPGVSAWLVKPINRSQFVATVGRLIGGAVARPDPAGVS